MQSVSGSKNRYWTENTYPTLCTDHYCSPIGTQPHKLSLGQFHGSQHVFQGRSYSLSFAIWDINDLEETGGYLKDKNNA